MKGSEQIRWEQIAANMIDLKKRYRKDQIDHIELEQKRSDRIGTERVVRVGKEPNATDGKEMVWNEWDLIASERKETYRKLKEIIAKEHKSSKKNGTVRIKQNGSKLKEHIPPT